MKNGISFIALITTIGIIMIISATVIISYENIIGNTKKSEFAREMYTLRKMVIDYEFMNSSYPIENEIVLDLNNINEASRSQFSSEPGYELGSVTLNTVNLAKAGVDNIVRGTKRYGPNDIYAFSNSTKRLYYVMGETIGNDIYYTLTDELYKIINIKDVK